jgi:type II secretory pathway pseudopilin PulG
MNTQRLVGKRLRVTEAFSLIEVVLALSIVAVGMVTIIGLFPQGLTSAKNAVDDSLCGMIAEDAIASRKIDIQTGNSTILAATIPPRWYAANGREIFVPPDLPTGATFQVNITATPVIGLPIDNVSVEQTRVQILWPWFSPKTDIKTPSPPNTNTFYTEITKY